MFIDPKAVISQLSLTGISTVADLGTGSGAWALEIATRLEGRGVVYGVDVQENMVTRLKHSADEARLVNVTAIHADIERFKGIPLRDGSLDLAVIANVLYCAESKDGVLAEVARLVRPGGKLLLIDWTGPHRGMGPDPLQVVSRVEGERLAALSGFELDHTIDAGAYHWALLLTRKAYSAARSSFAV